jgi:hypothetical protein
MIISWGNIVFELERGVVNKKFTSTIKEEKAPSGCTAARQTIAKSDSH